MTPPAATDRPKRLWPAVLAVALVVGCNGVQPPAKTAAQLQQENVQFQHEIVALRQAAAARDKQIETLQALGDKRLDLLYHVTGVQLGRYTGGIDLDDKPGHDGVRVYLTPRDQHGHAIKAAGKVKIQLFDLADKPAENLVGTFEFPVDQVAKHWAGGFITNHYKFDCHWKSPPANPDITVRVEFTDYLTGKTFADQTACKVTLAGK